MPDVTVTQPDRAVLGGQRYQFSVYTGAINAIVDAGISVYNAAGALVDTVWTVGAAANAGEKPGGPTLADFKRIGFFYTMPAGASKAVVNLRKKATNAGSTESWGFYTRVMLGEATADQTVFSPYQPGSVAKTAFSEIFNESYARITADSAIAESITTLTSRVGSNEATITTQATSINGLSAQYTVKVDNNGFVSGYGLASTLTTSGPISSFAVRADTFYIADPSGGSAPAMPFIVRTTATTINGEVVPVGVYMRDTFIQNGTIVSAMIGNAMITTAKIANLAVTAAQIANATITEAKIADLAVTTAKINDAAITTAKIGNAQVTTIKIGDATISTAKIQDLSVTTGKIVDANITNAKIANLAVTEAKIADLNVTNAKIGNASITNAKITGDIYSDNWTGAAGWYIRKGDGVAFFNRLVLYGVQSGSVGVPNNGTGQVVHATGRYIAVSLWSPSGNVAMTSLDGNQFTVRLDNSAGGTVYYAYV